MGSQKVRHDLATKQQQQQQFSILYCSEWEFPSKTLFVGGQWNNPRSKSSPACVVSPCHIREQIIQTEEKNTLNLLCKGLSSIVELNADLLT